MMNACQMKFAYLPLCLLFTVCAAASLDWLGGWFGWPGAVAAAPVVVQQVPAVCALPFFTAGNDYAEAGYGVTLAGDFNNDSNPDLVVASEGVKQFTLYLGDGRGAFTKGRSFTTAGTPTIGRVADFNGDGRADVVLLGYDASTAQDKLEIWISNGDGSFRTAGGGSTPRQIDYNTVQFHVADLNSDGRADAVLADSSGSEPLYYSMLFSPFNNAGFLLRVPDPEGKGSLPANARIVLGDVNIDGTTDLIIAQNDPGKLLLRTGIGNGTFRAANDIISMQSRITSIAATDFNRAGRRDLVITTAQRNGGTANDTVADSYRVIVVLSNGAGGYTTQSAQLPELARNLLIWQLVDLTTDGKPDVVLVDPSRFTSPSGVTFTVVNNGAGGLCDPQGGLASNSVVVGAANVFVDVNKDNKLDIVRRDFTKLSVAINLTGTPLPAYRLAFKTPQVTAGRFGHYDIASVTEYVNSNAQWRVQIVNAPAELNIFSPEFNGGTIVAVISPGCTLGTYRYTLRFTNEFGVSTTGEGTINVVAPPPLTPVTSESASPGPGFRQVTSLVFREGVSRALTVVPPRASTASNSDIVISISEAGVTTTPTVQVFLDNTQVSSTFIGSNFGSSTYFLTPVAGMRQLRMVLTEPCGQTTYTLPITVEGASANCVYPVFAAPQTYEAGATLGMQAVNDFNGDGRSDAVVWNATAKQLKTYLGQTNGTLTPSGTLAVNAANLSLVTADFNRDGKTDVAASYPRSVDGTGSQRGVTIFLGAGNGTFTLQRTYDVGNGWLTVGDFNNDGAADLAVTDLPDHAIGILLNDTRGTFTTRTLAAGIGSNNTETSIVTAHVNADSNLDIVVAGGAPSERPLYVFTGDGLGGFVDGSTNSVAGRENFGNWVFAGDFNNDRRADLAISYGMPDGSPFFTSNSLWLYRNNETANTFLNLRPSALATADFNRDGLPDLALNGSKVIVSSLFQPYCAVAPVPSLPNFTRMQAGDFNGDGRPDVVGVTTTGAMQLVLNATNPVNALSVGSATFSPNGVAPAAIGTIFGISLATSTLAATTTPLPMTLAGTQVRIRDSAGVERVAPLFFVSAGQINFQVPPESALGTAQVQVTSGAGTLSAGTIQITTIAPGIFTASANGRGLAAGQIVRVLANGTQRFEPIIRFDAASNSFIAVPIDLNFGSNEQVFLILYGTGLRGRTSLGNVTANFSNPTTGYTVPVAYLGAQGSLVGVDQVNIRLIDLLNGRGDLDVVLNVDGKLTNAVRINLK